MSGMRSLIADAHSGSLWSPTTKRVPRPDALIAPSLYGTKATPPIDGLATYLEELAARRRAENPQIDDDEDKPKPVFSEFARRAARRELEIRQKMNKQKQLKASCVPSGDGASDSIPASYLRLSDVSKDIVPRNDDDMDDKLRKNQDLLEERLNTYKSMLAATEMQKKRDDMKVCLTVGELRNKLAKARAEGLKAGQKDGHAEAVKLSNEEQDISPHRSRLTHHDLFNLPKSERSNAGGSAPGSPASGPQLPPPPPRTAISVSNRRQSGTDVFVTDDTLFALSSPRVRRTSLLF